MLLWLHAGALFAFSQQFFSTSLNLSQPASFFSISLPPSQLLNFSELFSTALVEEKSSMLLCLCRQEHCLHFSQQFSRLFSTSLNTPFFSQPAQLFSTNSLFLNQPRFFSTSPFFLNHPLFCSTTPSSLTLPSSLPCPPIPPKNTLKQGARPLTRGGPAPTKFGGGMVLQGFFSPSWLFLACVSSNFSIWGDSAVGSVGSSSCKRRCG